MSPKSTPLLLRLSRNGAGSKNTKAQRPRKFYVTGSLLACFRRTKMSIDKNKITTQDELNEPAPMDQADERADAEMKRLERKAKKDVAEGLRQTDEEVDKE